MEKIIKNNILKGFTLVELIIVITILAILSTIAFISFQWYSKNSRDGNRLTTMKNIENWLNLFEVKTWNYPEPDENINIEANWILLWYQWKIWESISRNININVKPTDPYDNEKYIYSTNSNKTKYQILWYLETPDYLSFLKTTYASNYINRYVKVLWSKIWIILNEDKSPITWTWIDISTWSTIYNAYFWDNDNVSWSWNLIFSNMYTRRDDLLNNKNLTILDESLVWYWDMETLTGGKLKDFSKYENNWTLNGWIIIWWANWATYFDWIDDYISVDDSDSLNFYAWDEYTIMTKFKISSSPWNWKFYRFIQKASPNVVWYNLSVNSENIFELWQRNDWWEYETSVAWLVDSSYNNFHFIAWKRSSWNLVINLNWNNIYYKTWAIWNLSNTWAFNVWKNWYWWASDEFFHGTIDEIRVYNRALSDTEIQSIYNSTK